MADEEPGVDRAPGPATAQPQTSQLFDYGVHCASRTIFLFEEINRASAAKVLPDGLASARRRRPADGQDQHPRRLPRGGALGLRRDARLPRGARRRLRRGLLDGRRHPPGRGRARADAERGRHGPPGLFESVGFDHDENTQRTGEYAGRMRDRCCEILAEKMGITLKQFLRRFTWDTYLSARQAVELGLADRVVEPHASLSLVPPQTLKAG